MPRPQRQWFGLRRIWRAGLDVILPPLCLNCQTRLADHDALCPDCWRRIDFIRPPLCDRLGLPMPYDTGGTMISAAAAADPPPYDRARAVARYDGVMRELIHDFKFRDTHDAPASVWPLANTSRDGTRRRCRLHRAGSACAVPSVVTSFQPGANACKRDQSKHRQAALSDGAETDTGDSTASWPDATATPAQCGRRVCSYAVSPISDSQPQSSADRRRNDNGRNRRPPRPKPSKRQAPGARGCAGPRDCHRYGHRHHAAIGVGVSRPMRQNYICDLAQTSEPSTFS